MKKTWIVKTLVLALVAVLGFGPAAFADRQTDELKAQVKALTERISHLEQQLAEKSQPAPAAAYTSPLASDDWDPFFQTIRAQMNQLFQNSFDRGFGPGHVNLLGPRTDVKQTPQQYILTMDLPGMEKDSINVEVKNGMLIISGERSAQEQVKGDQFFRQERSFGQFLRTLPLPEDAKPDDVKADYKNGVLEVKIGRASEGKPAGGKKITVN
jgi:HSP20 family protein